MPSKIRTTIVSIMTLIVFVFSAVFTVPVLADEETPPPPDAGEVTEDLPPVEGTEPAPPVEQEPPLAEVPEGTEVVVLDEQGETVPLATQEAAEIIADPDPIWCPSGVAIPKPGMNGCTNSFASFAALLAFLGNDLNEPAKDGTIWIEKDFDSGTQDPGQNFTLDGAGNFTTMSNYRLTIKGGWEGCTPTCVSTIDIYDPSEFNGRLLINNWNNDVTLSDLYFISTSGSDPFSIYTTKNITLTRVTSQGNFSGGGYLDNSAGTGKITINSSMFLNNAGFSGLRAFSKNLITLNNVTATGNTGYGVFVNGTPGTADILINGGQFNNNQGLAGLHVSGNGMITLNNVTASGNSGAGTSNGAELDNTGSPSAKGITLSGVNTFNNNKNHGLSIATAGAITANDVTADDNGITGTYGYGVVLNNTYASGPKPITFTGTNIFTDNRDGGLYINTFGAVKLNSVHANSNNGMGVYIYNAGAATAQAVTLSGTSTFKYNNGGGLWIDSKGLITLNNITANSNTNGYGVYLTNVYNGFSSGVNITGTNTFNDNDGDGLRVMTRGAISAANLNATGNGDNVSEFGVYLYNYNPVGLVKSVTLSGVNTFNQNYGGGLYVISLGAITANSLNANGNTNGYGVSLENSSAATAQAVKLTGTNVFSGNQSYGLYVSSLGAISVNSFTANSNGTPSSTVHGVYLYNNTAGQGVTISGVNTASNNYLSGLYVTSQGTITVNSLTADENGLTANGSGASITNTGGTGNVIFTGTSSFDGNQGAGLDVNSAGTVTLSNINASNSVDSVGVFVQNTNSGASAPKNVTLSGVNVFSNNDDDGLSISTYGTVTLNSVSAVGNGTGGSGNGATVINSGGTLAKDVILTGTNVFSDNDTNGLGVSSLGSIKINNVTANNNGFTGVNLNNMVVTYTGGITLTGTNTFNNNDANGLYVSSYGIITASNLNATGNGGGGSGYGAYIENSGNTTKTITLSGVNKFNNNQSGGLYAFSWGTITASNLNASDNLSGRGVQLANDGGSSTAGVTLSGVSVFNNNYYSGLEVSSFGIITLNTASVQANGNGTNLLNGYGIYLANAGAATPKAVTIKGNNTLLSNFSSGLRVTSKGAITVNNLISNGSINGAGADLDNEETGAVGGVTITGTNIFNNNYNDGLHVVTLGAITTNNITANQNGLTTSYSGASLASSGAGQAIKMTGANTFNGNQFSGLSINSLGAVSINNLTANDTNAGGGAAIFNNGGGAGNVILTGLNTFNNNSGNGLQIGSNGNVSMTKIYADGNTGDGVYTNPDGTVTLTCGNFTNNNGSGFYLLSLTGITITGVVSAGNGSADVLFGASPVVTRNCPLP